MATRMKPLFFKSESGIFCRPNELYKVSIDVMKEICYRRTKGKEWQRVGYTREGRGGMMDERCLTMEEGLCMSGRDCGFSVNLSLTQTKD
jgi:hypothetical protein